ncbi:enoyl-CoA hydratase/isomerase family protein [Mesorhizobium sp.]|uniref:enoyl-CoA hydratase/isomerase family protein n=1 Tax=Mesorhizobium sp. TaxID=1871066 RepID=UPI000FE5686B|nr:enoyl-CoA hydratase/isomerase family protein [Mesorhizobium sp.]RWI88924.1 MAG: enoyl-CoA hydratase/isomerase family protein [Mesorhizobium sp.]
MAVHQRVEDAVCVLTLDRPPVNALNRDFYAEFLSLLAEIASNDNIRVVVLEAAPGLRAFSAGADIKEFERLFDPETAREFFSLAHEVPNAVESLEKITIAAVDGPALGGGAELLLSFDFRILSRRAKIGFPEVKVGQFPGTGGTLRLPWLVGEAAAKEMLLSGAMIDAERAFALRLATEVVEAGDAATAALELAHRLSRHPAQAVAAVKRSVLGNRDRNVAAGTRRDTALSLWVGNSPDAHEGHRSFVERREPQFTHAVTPFPGNLHRTNT